MFVWKNPKATRWRCRHTLPLQQLSLERMFQSVMFCSEFVFYPGNFTLTKGGELQLWAGLKQPPFYV